MFRYFLSLTFAAGIASAATISTSATCDGVTTVGTFSASCASGMSISHANLNVGPGFAFGVGVYAIPSSESPPFPPQTVASANFSDDYVFTVTGGTRNGTFFPCFSASSDVGSSVSMSFGGIGYGISDLGQLFPVSNCLGKMPTGSPAPFTLGIPQIVQVDIMGAAGFMIESGASESLDQILFFDPSGNLLSNVTFTLVEVPEPSAWSLLSIGLLFLMTVRTISRADASPVPSPIVRQPAAAG
jgi:hypothetical protein